MRQRISRRSLFAGLPAAAGCSLLALSSPGPAQERAADRESHPIPPTVADDAQPVLVYADDRFFEGPAWDPKTGKLYFTAFGADNQQILRLDGPDRVTVWMDKTEGINGMYLSRSGRLLGAQAYGHHLLSMEIGESGPEDIQRLTSSYQGVPYLQPNDVAESPVTGGIYYTDPNFAGKTRSAVYFLDPDSRRPRRIIEHLKIPNGVLVSNDGATLYVGDSFEKRIYSYPILDDGSVDQGRVRVFFDPKTSNMADPDGMSADENGNLYFAMRGGVWVASPRGESLGLIPLPEFCSNVTFGGDNGRTLYMTCNKRLYSLRMRVRGAQFR